MTINDGATDIDTVTTTSNKCPLATIWSNLVTLNEAQNYNILLSVDYGCILKGDIWWCGYGAEAQTCRAYCAEKNLSCVDISAEEARLLTCDDMKLISGESYPCSVSRSYCQPCGYHYYSGPIEKFESLDAYGGWSCDCSAFHNQPFCPCANAQALSYSFTFTAPAA